MRKLLLLWMLEVAAQTTASHCSEVLQMVNESAMLINHIRQIRCSGPGRHNDQSKDLVAPVPQMLKENDGHNKDNRQYISKGLREMSINLDHLLRRNMPDENTLFSPIPIANAMGLLLLGSKRKTAQEISSLFGNNPEFISRPDLLHEELGSLIDDLKLKPGVSKGLEVSIGAAVFPNKGHEVKTDYIEKAKRIYHSDVIPLDYSHQGDDAKKIINEWVSNATNNRITSILERAPEPSTSIVLVSAIYFNCEWKHPFPITQTTVKSFYTGKSQNGEEEFFNVPMMLNTAEAQYFEDKNRQLQLLGLPYKGEEIFMYIVLPEGDLKQTLGNLRETDLKSMINSCKNRKAIYTLPKMKLEAIFHLESLLPELGVSSLFDPTTAELDDIALKTYVNEIIHKVEIEVTETGTTASAVTGAATNRDGSTPVVNVNKPFLFFIYHVKTDSFLFWGTVMRPTPNTSPKG